MGIRISEDRPLADSCERSQSSSRDSDNFSVPRGSLRSYHFII